MCAIGLMITFDSQSYDTIAYCVCHHLDVLVAFDILRPAFCSFVLRDGAREFEWASLSGLDARD
jgi:hypothetical protein